MVGFRRDVPAIRAAVSAFCAALVLVMWLPQPLPADGEITASYAFSEGSGSITTDFSGYGNTGVLTGGPTWTTAGR